MRAESVIHQSIQSAAVRLPRRRRGASVLELVVGAVILGVFISAVGPMIRWVHVSRRMNERHQTAMQELSNQMEQIAALPPAQLSTERLDALTISATTQTLLPEPVLTATMTPDADQMRRVTLAIGWTNDAGMTVEPRRLTAWFPSATEGAPE